MSRRGRRYAGIPNAGEHTLRRVPDSVESIWELVDRVTATVHESVEDPQIIALARQVVSSVPHGDKRGEIAALDLWLRDRLRYVYDPIEVETTETPARMIREFSRPREVVEYILGPVLSGILSGRLNSDHVPPAYRRLHGVGVQAKALEDCEGLSEFAATMFSALGHRTSVRLGGWKQMVDGARICVPQHAWVGVWDGEEWVDADYSEPGRSLGWFFPDFGCYIHHPIFY